MNLDLTEQVLHDMQYRLQVKKCTIHNTDIEYIKNPKQNLKQYIEHIDDNVKKQNCSVCYTK